VILMVVFVAPFGIFLMWRNNMFPKYARIMLSVIFGFIFLVVFFGSMPGKPPVQPVATVEDPIKTEEVVAPAAVEAPVAETTAPGALTTYDYKEFAGNTILTFYPLAKPGFMNYSEWNTSGTQYIKTSFMDNTIEHTFLMRCSTDMTQIFYVAIDDQKVFYDGEAEMAYMSAQ